MPKTTVATLRADNRRTAILATIAELVVARGYPPSVSELSRRHGVSPRQIRADLDLLVDTGKIERAAGVARGIRVKQQSLT